MFGNKHLVAWVRAFVSVLGASIAFCHLHCHNFSPWFKVEGEVYKSSSIIVDRGSTDASVVSVLKNYQGNKLEGH